MESENIMIHLLLGLYNIRKLDKICNDKVCGMAPTKKVFVYEYKKFVKKGIVSLYLCEEHVKSIKGFVDKLKEMEPKKIIGKDITELGR